MIAKSSVRQSRNLDRGPTFLEKVHSASPVIPEIPPSPPFNKGGLGGISEADFPIGFA